MTNRHPVILAGLLLAAVLTARAHAQAPCTHLTGTVTDTTAALIPNATLTVDATLTRTSGPDGRFTFPCVAPGRHTLTASSPTFATGTLAITTPHPAAITFRLLPAADTSITVSADEADDQVPAPGGANGLIVAGKQLQALADDPDDLLRELQQLAAQSGGNPANTVISVDGFQDAAQLPPKDSIAYINVSPDLFSAEYREPPFGGGRVEVYTKPGAKNYHGALFATNSSPFLNAREPFTTSSQGTVGKQRYGFDLSGPIRKQGSNFSLNLEHRSIDELAVVNATDPATNAAILDSVAQPQRLWVGQARVDYQFNPKNITFATYSANVNTTLNSGVGGQTLREAGYSSHGIDQTVRFSDITTISPKLLHEARIAEEWSYSTDLPNSNTPSTIVSGFFTGGGATLGTTRQFASGFEYDDDLIRTTSASNIKTGFQLLFKARNSNLLESFNGTYTFSSAASYLSQTPAQFSNVTGNPNVITRQVRFGAFFQQDLKLQPNFTFSYGLRYTLETDPATFRNFEPRLGLAWTLDQKKTLTLKSHFGVFHGQYSSNEAEEIHREDGVQRITSKITNPIYGSPFLNATPVTAYRTLAPGVTPGTYVLGDFGLSKDLPFGFNLNAELTLARFLTYARTVDINQPLTSNSAGPRPFGPNVNILQVQYNGTGQGNGLFLGLSNFKHKRAGFFLGALKLNLRDNTDDSTFFQPQSAYTDQGEEARRTGNPLWQVFGNFNVTLPLKLSFSGNINAQGQSPFNLLTGNDDNGDGSFNDRPAYAPAGAVADNLHIFATPFGLMTNAVTLINGIPQNPIQRNLGSLPWVFHLDVNLQRAFVLTHNPKADHQQTLTANIRSANFINHPNYTALGNVLGTPDFLQPLAADTARRVEFGLRYSF